MLKQFSLIIVLLLTLASAACLLVTVSHATDRPMGKKSQGQEGNTKSLRDDGAGDRRARGDATAELALDKAIELASSYDAKGDTKGAIGLLEQSYEKAAHSNPTLLGRYRDDEQEFSHLKKLPEVAQRFPKLLRGDTWKPEELDASNAEVEYQYTVDPEGMNPRLSPSGKEILYTVCTEEQCNLWAIRLDGKQKRIVARNARDGDWLPDEKRVAFIHNQAGVEKIHLLDTTTGKEYPLITLGSFGLNSNELLWLPERQSIVLLWPGDTACSGYALDLDSLRLNDLELDVFIGS